MIVDLFPYTMRWIFRQSAAFQLVSGPEGLIRQLTRHTVHVFWIAPKGHVQGCWQHTVLLKILKRTSHTLKTPVGSRRL